MNQLPGQNVAKPGYSSKAFVPSLSLDDDDAGPPRGGPDHTLRSPPPESRGSGGSDRGPSRVLSPKLAQEPTTTTTTTPTTFTTRLERVASAETRIASELRTALDSRLGSPETIRSGGGDVDRRKRRMEPARRQPPASGSLDNSDNNNGSELYPTTTTTTNHNNNNDNNKNNNEPCGAAQRVWISSDGSEKQSRIRFPRLAQSDGAHTGIPNLDTKGNRNSIESAPKLEVTSPRFVMISPRASQQISDKDRIIKEALASRKGKLYRRLPGRGTSPDKYYRRFHATTNLHSKVFC